MEPIPATATALRWLADSGDDRIAATVASISGAVSRVVPVADAVTVAFVDEDLTFAMTRSSLVPLPAALPPPMRSSLELTFGTPARASAVVGLYSELAEAFTTTAMAIESSLGAVPGSAVIDADLEFEAAHAAGLAPARISTRVVVGTAVGLLEGAQGFTPEQAEDWFEHQVLSTGRTELEVARMIVDAHDFPLDDDLVLEE
jgi:hypothetical protein